MAIVSGLLVAAIVYGIGLLAGLTPSRDTSSPGAPETQPAPSLESVGTHAGADGATSLGQLVGLDDGVVVVNGSPLPPAPVLDLAGRQCGAGSELSLQTPTDRALETMSVGVVVSDDSTPDARVEIELRAGGDLLDEAVAEHGTTGVVLRSDRLDDRPATLSFRALTRTSKCDPPTIRVALPNSIVR